MKQAARRGGEARSFFAPFGRLSEVISDYEHRPQQEEMADAVERALDRGTKLAVEAGTGVGKSLAYLVPAALWARKTNKRVAISTYTRLLQAQLIRQDVPLLERLIVDAPSFAVAYGQENYLCRFRLGSRVTHGLFDTREEAADADRLLKWAENTEHGVLLDCPFPVRVGLATRIGRDSATCRGRRCPFFGECFYFRARATWAASSVLIVNHALFFAALATEPEILPKADAVIFDEAHRLEDAAVRHFGAVVSRRALTSLLDAVCPRAGRGLLDALGYPAATRANIAREVEVCRVELGGFFDNVAGLIPSGETRVRIRQAMPAPPAGAPERLADAIAEATEDADDEELAAELGAVSRRLRETAADLLRFAQPDPGGDVWWVETADRNRTDVVAAPMAIDCALAERVYPGFSSVILTSATLTVARDFTFLSERLGLDGFQTLLLDSPFDYPRAGLLYANSGLSDPSDPDYTKRTAETIARILAASRGRALILFTSYDSLNRVADLLPETDFTVLRQGQFPTAQLLDLFRKDIHSVLFATQSFWQGIDVPGESLSCLIICRLPFDVPDEPRLTAICESLRAEGKEPFTAYQLPNAVLRFRQGFGRLIRTSRDRGIVCVLDPRILRRSYGRHFLRSLPPNLPRTDNLADLATFLPPPTPGP